MRFSEKRKSLFVAAHDYHLAHSISADYIPESGVSHEMFKRFHLTEFLRYAGEKTCPDCVGIGRIFTLVTTKNLGDEPTYDAVKQSITYMKQQCISENVKKLAMPRFHESSSLGWTTIRGILDDVFGDTDIEILVCY